MSGPLLSTVGNPGRAPLEALFVTEDWSPGDTIC
jgi:hypothetical protein